MSGWADDLESSHKMVVEAVRELHKLNPKHELLRFWLLQKGEETSEEIEEQNRIEMKNRFWDRPGTWKGVAGVIVLTVVFSNYWDALRKAIEEIKGITHVPAKSEKEMPAPAVDEEVDVPF